MSPGSFALPRAVLRGTARGAPRRRAAAAPDLSVVPSYLTQFHRVRRSVPSPRTRSLRAPPASSHARSCLSRHASRRWRPRASTRSAAGVRTLRRELTPPRSMTVPAACGNRRRVFAHASCGAFRHHVFGTITGTLTRTVRVKWDFPNYKAHITACSSPWKRSPSSDTSSRGPGLNLTRN